MKEEAVDCSDMTAVPEQDRRSGLQTGGRQPAVTIDIILRNCGKTQSGLEIGNKFIQRARLRAVMADAEPPRQLLPPPLILMNQQGRILIDLSV